MFVCAVDCNPIANSTLHTPPIFLRFEAQTVHFCFPTVSSQRQTVKGVLHPTVMYEISFVDDDSEDFRIQDLLGEGSFAQVYKCVETKSQTVFALKEFDLKHKEFDEKTVEQEVLVWTDVVHENIVRLYTSFATGSYMYFVLEYVDGGSLFNHMMQRHKYSEKEAANILKQVKFSFFSIDCCG